MTLAFVENGSISQYPIGSVEVKRKFPQTSFVLPLEGQDLSDFGVVTVYNTPQPTIDNRNERIEEGVPVLERGAWRQTWKIVPLSAEEKQRIQDNKSSEVRADRSRRLASCDWTQLGDALVDASAWIIYRQALRDISDQSGFPWDIVWPNEPA